MRLFKDLWNDESGVVMSAETVMLGTVGVLGAVTGLSAVTTAVDQELKEFAGAIRSLDQSYGYVGHRSCRAWSAGSYYRQAPVQPILVDVCADGQTDIRTLEKQIDSQRAIPAPQPQVDPLPEPPATPNRISLPGDASK
jgi:hypothetical protein